MAEHHSHHHHKDSAQLFKERQLREAHRKKLFSNALFLAACSCAIIIVLAVIYLYTHE